MADIQQHKSITTISPMPVYHQIKADICLRIQRGEWQVGTKVPARSMLAREYAVALNTLQHAIADLIEEGVLQAENGRGTFIAKIPEIVAAPDSLPTFAPSLNNATSPSFFDGRTPTIGIIGVINHDYNPDSETPWILTVTQALEHQFAQLGGRSNFYAISDGDVSILRHTVSAAITDGVDALAIVNVDDYPGWTQEILATVDPTRPPTMYVSWDDIQAPFPHLFYDQQYAGMLAAQHLIQSGYKQLAFYTPYRIKWLDERIDGARRALRLSGQSDTDLICSLETAPEGFWKFTDTATIERVLPDIEHLIRHLDTTVPCGLLCPNDHIAVLVREVVERLGYIVGPQIGIVGFDDIQIARLHGITSMRPPLIELGEAAASALARALNGETLPMQTRFCSNLIPRNSSYCPTTERKITTQAL